MFTEIEEKEIIKMYKENINVDDIIKCYSTTEHYIREVLKRNQIDRLYNKFTDELIQRLIYLYRDKKYTQARICNDLLVSQNGIKKILARNGVDKRSYSECNQKYKRNSNYFDDINEENKAYYLGLIYADGNNFSNHNAISISLQEEDGYLIERFKEEVEYEGPVKYDYLSEINPNYKNQTRIVINDEHMSKRLFELGVVDKKSLVLTFPNFLDYNMLRHFCRGYFDGDGGVYYDKKRNRLTTSTVGTYDFTSTLKNILYSFGCSSNIYHPKQSKQNNTYILGTCGNNSSLKYLSWLYEDCDIKMLRKYNKYLFGKENFGNDGNLTKVTNL